MPRSGKVKEQEDSPPETVSACLKRIITSSSYDDVGEDLYRIMCHGKNMPYERWVETWLIKCIDECFTRTPVKKDIMFAYFALLPGYDLYGSIEDRLMYYAKNSGYLRKYPSSSKRSFDEIENDPDVPKRDAEIKEIKGKITRMQRELTAVLVDYIEGIPPAEHIASLSRYGECKTINGVKIVCPFPVKLNVPKAPLGSGEPEKLTSLSANCTERSNSEVRSGEESHKPEMPIETENADTGAADTAQDDENNEEESAALFTDLQEPVMTILAYLRKPMSLPLWVVVLSLVCLIALHLPRCSYNTTRYVDRRNGVEYTQTSISYGPPLKEIEARDPILGDEKVDFPISQPLDERE